jgi:hypothetical protein
LYLLLPGLGDELDEELGEVDSWSVIKGVSSQEGSNCGGPKEAADENETVEVDGGKLRYCSSGMTEALLDLVVCGCGCGLGPTGPTGVDCCGVIVSCSASEDKAQNSPIKFSSTGASLIPFASKRLTMMFYK